jgi:hypothetical protein
VQIVKSFFFETDGIDPFAFVTNAATTKLVIVRQMKPLEHGFGVARCPPPARASATSFQ